MRAFTNFPTSSGSVARPVPVSNMKPKDIPKIKRVKVVNIISFQNVIGCVAEISFRIVHQGFERIAKPIMKV